jgi:hypothetical protein
MITQILTMRIRTQLTALRSIGLSFKDFETSWHIAPGQIQPQKERRRKKPERNTEAMTITLRFTTPSLKLMNGGAGAR